MFPSQQAAERVLGNMGEGGSWEYLMAIVVHCRGLNPEKARELVLPLEFTEVTKTGVR